MNRSNAFRCVRPRDLADPPGDFGGGAHRHSDAEPRAAQASARRFTAHYVVGRPPVCQGQAGLSEPRHDCVHGEHVHELRRWAVRRLARPILLCRACGDRLLGGEAYASLCGCSRASDPGGLGRSLPDHLRRLVHLLRERGSKLARVLGRAGARAASPRGAFRKTMYPWRRGRGCG